PNRQQVLIPPDISTDEHQDPELCHWGCIKKPRRPDICGALRTGGRGRNRTGVHGFAIRCMTTLPPGLKRVCCPVQDRTTKFTRISYFTATSQLTANLLIVKRFP